MVLWHIIFWAVLTVILIGSEIATVQLISVWFGAGSLIAFISSFFAIEFYVQVIIFIAVSIVLLLSTRPFVKKFLNSSNHIKTNSDSIVGKECIVKEEVNSHAGTGRVFADGLTWAAKSAFPEKILKENETCIITDIQGVTLIIKSLEA
ncbi:MAG: NfeD family protein [Oscillospiraceae bacterium]